MKRAKEDYPSFNLFSIVGTWESVNLNPTIILYRSWKIQCKLPPKTKRFCPLVLK